VLQDNELLVVDGRVCRELQCSLSDDQEMILVNGVPYGRPLAASVNPRRDPLQPDTIQPADGDWSKSPFVAREIERGCNLQTAIQHFRAKLRELVAYATRTRTDQDEQAWAASVQEWIDAPNNMGIADLVMSWGGVLSVSIVGVNDALTIPSTVPGCFDGPVEARTPESVCKGLVRFFEESTSGAIVLVLRGGAGAFMGGRSIEATRQQILAMAAAGVYVDGPMKESDAIGYGLVPGIR
jgi:hypothetical protein